MHKTLATLALTSTLLMGGTSTAAADEVRACPNPRHNSTETIDCFWDQARAEGEDMRPDAYHSFTASPLKRDGRGYYFTIDYVDNTYRGGSRDVVVGGP